MNWPEPERGATAISGFLAGVFVVIAARADTTDVQLFFYGAAALFGYAALFAKMHR
jgi:hypothetical protein